MQADQKTIKGLFRKDVLLLVVFTVLAVCMMLFTLTNILALTEGGTRAVIIITAVVSMLFLAWTALEVIIHLCRHREAVYTEEIENQELIRQYKHSCKE